MNAYALTPVAKTDIFDIWSYIAEDSEGGKAMNKRYAVISEQAESNWAAYVPDLPGCVTTGKTLEETGRNVREAISGHLRTLREFGEPIPEPTSVAREIEISPAA